MRVIDRLDSYISYKGLNDNKVTVSAGLSVSIISRARSNPKKDLGPKSIERILNAFPDINPHWLLYGDGEMIVEPSKDLEKEKNNIEHENASIKDRLLLFIEHKNIPISRFERVAKMSNGHVNNIGTHIGPDLLKRILIAYPDLNPDWLISGSGSMLRQEEVVVNTDDTVKFIDLPFIPMHATATFVPNISQCVRDGDRFRVLKLEGVDYKGRAALEVCGDSMWPTLPDRSVVMVKEVDAGDWVYMSSGVYVVVYRDAFTVKRIKDNDLLTKGLLTLHSDNDAYGAITIRSEDLRSVWKVERVIDSVVR